MEECAQLANYDEMSDVMVVVEHFTAAAPSMLPFAVLALTGSSFAPAHISVAVVVVDFADSLDPHFSHSIIGLSID